jgi:carbonic anhydrase
MSRDVAQLGQEQRQVFLGICASFGPCAGKCRSHAAASTALAESLESTQLPPRAAVCRHVPWSRFALVPCLALLLGGCHAQPQVQPEPAKKVAKKAGARAKKAEARKEREAERAPETFTVPFAWEAAKDEPLALTRSFLRDAFSDNDTYMQRGDKFFAAFADKQTPRATVITCADSRVHSQAWDSTPENDDFTVRDIGNQVENVEGSVEYGIEHLHTPLLLVIGHTGCGAVKAAMGDTSKLSEPIRKELEHLHVPAADPSKAPEVAWAEAVVANVNNQVAFSLKRFNREVHEGTLTVVGAVYDFRNDLGQGAGKLVIVNVNGNADADRMESFVDAVNGRLGPRDAKDAREAKSTKDRKDSKEKSGKAEHAEAPSATKDIAGELAQIRGINAQASAAEPLAVREAAAVHELAAHPSAHEH